MKAILGDRSWMVRKILVKDPAFAGSDLLPEMHTRMTATDGLAAGPLSDARREKGGHPPLYPQAPEEDGRWGCSNLNRGRRTKSERDR